MSNVFEFAADPTLTVYPAAQSECAQVKIEGERYRRTVAVRQYGGEWVRWFDGSYLQPLTDAELAALRAAPRQHICG
jgi:hypothetical protein